MPGATTTIVSVGYERRTIDDLIELLQLGEVDVLVDVRLNPISRKKGFSKNALSQALAEAGIGYRHARELGNPKENREPFRRGLLAARKRYEEHLRNGASAVHNEIMELAHDVRVALLCYEREHRECHRSSILDVATQQYAVRVLAL